MHLLITGGAGFIGSRLTDMAVRRGHTVTIIDDLSTGHRDNVVSLPARLVVGSVTDLDEVCRLLKGVDSVIHLAALGSVPRSIEAPFTSHHANATGTLTVLEAARRCGVAHLVSASSSSVYGRNPSLPKQETDWVRPLSPYAVTKLATEQYTLAYQESFGLSTTAFRFFNVYGPGQRGGHAYAAVIPAFLEAILSGRPVCVHGDGNQTRDFTYVDTVCDVLLRTVVEKLCHPTPVNLAFGTTTSMNELVDKLRQLTKSPVAVEHGPPRAGDVPASRADNVTLRTLFPDLSPVALDEGLSRTAQWFGVL